VESRYYPKRRPVEYWIWLVVYATAAAAAGMLYGVGAFALCAAAWSCGYGAGCAASRK
jgi:hypothetical protein